ncbi:MAG: HAMP domain-containing histidine kinase [Bacteroidota bacterium]|nr:HAMP domain-containing histidine kinase [Bacteroidota bacterium]MDX5430588.1 HAMP domain-containing histidine kinase [Bacteroidota bacterium]MDX5469340.1 HAMP domain-containing histidine kinase [Bacteroidota bacterium]
MSFQFKQIWKIVLLIFAVNIAIMSLLYTNQLVRKLAIEEQNRVNQWTAAMQRLIDSDDEDVTFLLDVTRTSSNNIPIILTDEEGTILNYQNIDTALARDPDYLREELLSMKKENEPIVIEYLEGKKNYVYYHNSTLLTQLKRYPYYQIGIISLFLLVSYLAFNSSRRSEQNRVWVGLAKETAHQLGTPISSLIAWVDLFKDMETAPTPEMLEEIEKDVQRLRLVSERFSKIGSTPILEDMDIKSLIDQSVGYMSTRASNKVSFEVHADELHNCFARVNVQLFDWVLENITKNAIDAMEGQGKIAFVLSETKNLIHIDISDTGKGIPSSKTKDVFKPGFTTKKRGWGLGLSLAKRIIEEYHRGKIFVKESTVGKGTTFRITLKKR